MDDDGEFEESMRKVNLIGKCTSYRNDYTHKLAPRLCSIVPELVSSFFKLIATIRRSEKNWQRGFTTTTTKHSRIVRGVKFTLTTRFCRIVSELISSITAMYCCSCSRVYIIISLLLYQRRHRQKSWI